MSGHFIIQWSGNKLHEYKNFKDYIDLNDKKNIIEPFCGTSSIII